MPRENVRRGRSCCSRSKCCRAVTKSTRKRKNEFPVLVLWAFFVANCPDPMLAVADLRKSFISPEGGRAMIVNVPAFDLAPGSQLALRGESGSGKTTFLNLI